MNLLTNNTTIFATTAGFVLDSILGDPQNPYHPIRLIGIVIAGFIRLYEKLKPKNSKLQFIFGAVMSLLVVLLFYFGTKILIDFTYHINIIVGVIVESIVCYFIIAAKSLYNESIQIHKLLSESDLAGARRRLSFIVGRDTENLSEEKVIKATVETVSENLSDGVIAPLLFLFLGGAPLGMAYKAVNTLDSMVGYRNETYEYFGKFAARLDDFVNLIPARLSAMLIIWASLFCNKDFKGAIAVYRRDRYKHLSPNSAHTEAVCAGALGIQLGGTSTYKGKIIEKPTIGDNNRNADIKDIKDSSVLMYTAAIIALLLGLLLSVLLRGWRYV